MSDTQRDEWLFKTEPLQGARPRWDEDGRPPVVFDQTGVVDMEAAGGGGQSECGTARRSDPYVAAGAADFAGGGGEDAAEEGGSRTRGPSGAIGGHRAPEHQLPPGGTRVVPNLFSDVRARDVGPDRRSGGWSPRNVLEDTVARMQRDLADIRAKNRLLRTAWVQPVVPTPGRRLLRRPRYLGLVERPVGSSISRSLTL